MNDNLTPMEAEERPTLRKEILLEACRAQCLFCADKAETIWDGKMNPYGKGDINPDPVKLERQYVPNCGEMEGWAHHRSFGGFSECSAGNIRDLLAATPVALPEDFGITKPQPKVEGMGALTAEDMRGFSDEEIASFVCDEVYTPVAPEVTQPACKHCGLPIRETHMGRWRNEWEHMNGMSYCGPESTGKATWAWPAEAVPSAEPVAPTTYNPDENELSNYQIRFIHSGLLMPNEQSIHKMAREIRKWRGEENPDAV